MQSKNKYGLFVSHTCPLCFSHDYSLLCSQPFCKQRTYSFDLRGRDLQIRNCTQDWCNYFSLTPRLSFTFFQTNKIILRNVLEAEDSRSHLLEDSNTTTLLFLHSYISPHACCCWIRFLMYLLACICAVCIVYILVV